MLRGFLKRALHTRHNFGGPARAAKAFPGTSTQWARCLTEVANNTTSTRSSGAGDVLLEEAHIEEAIKVQPKLAGTAPELWRRTHETFINHGLYTTNFLRIVTGNPAVLTRSPQRIVECLEMWRSCQFGERMLHLLITKYPELLDVPNERQLRTHVSYLKSFACTNKNVWKLLMNCPNLLEQTEERIEEKLTYLQQTMRLEVPEIVKSEALGKSLEEIRVRHVFLERLGLFKPRKPKADPDEPTKNNRLYQITDTSEKAFATKICHVSLEEFEVFKELYRRELARKRRQSEEDELSDEE